LVREHLPEGAASVPGDTRFVATAMQRLAATLALEVDDLPTAKEWLDAHDRWLAWSSAVLGRAEGQALWAQYHRQIGDRQAADEHAQRALAAASDPRQPLALIAAHRLLGELATDVSRYADAETHLDASLALADACAAPYERALTLLALAALRAETGEIALARSLIDEARVICEPLAARPALARADALAARLTATPAIPPAYPAGLSAREVEVLRLLTAGCTNREIAAALFLSERTVEVHVRHILTKTRTDNRAAATAFALRNDLA
jgi:DNA-binding CsgD family transcriptional regulator